MNGKNFNNDDDIESYLIQFFANKNHKFYELGMLPERSLIKMGNTLQFHEKIVFDFLKKIRNYLVANPIDKWCITLDGEQDQALFIILCYAGRRVNIGGNGDACGRSGWTTILHHPFVAREDCN